MQIEAGTLALSGETTSVGTLNLSGGSVALTSGTLTVANANLTIANGSDLHLGENATLNLGTATGTSTEALNKNIVGSGKIIWGNERAAHKATINLSNDFTGTLQFSGKLRANAGDNFIKSFGGTQTLILDGVDIWTNDSNTTDANGIGNIAVDVVVGSKTANEKGSNLYVAGSGITFSGNFEASGKNVEFANGTTNTFAGTNTTIGSLTQTSGTLTLSGETANIDTLTQTSGTLTLSGKTVNIGTLTQTSGTLSFVGQSTIFSGSSAQLGKLELKNGGNASLGNANGSALTVTATNLQIHNASENETETLTVNSGTTLNITSENKDNAISAGVLLGHWKEGKGILNVNGGVVNAKNTLTMVSWDSEGELNINNGGKYNTHGIVMGVNDSSWGDRTSRALVSLNSGGTLNLGSGGIYNANNNKTAGEKTINLAGGTLGAFDSWSSEMAMTLARDSTSTVNTENSEGTNTGHNITLSGKLSGAGALRKTGTGTLKLSGANDYSGGTEIDTGTLVAANEKALGNGAVSVSSGAALQANAEITFSTAAQTLTLVVGEAQVVPAVATFSLRNSGASGTALVTAQNGGKITVTDAAKVYIDVSALAQNQALLGEAVSLSLAAESALEFNDTNANIGWWNDAGAWTEWGIVNDYTYDSASGVLTLTIPEPSAFGLLAGLSALALVVSRRRRK